MLPFLMHFDFIIQVFVTMNWMRNGSFSFTQAGEPLFRLHYQCSAQVFKRAGCHLKRAL